MVQWQNASFPSLRRGFNSPCPHSENRIYAVGDSRLPGRSFSVGGYPAQKQKTPLVVFFVFVGYGKGVGEAGVSP